MCMANKEYHHLRERRLSLGLSQKALADYIGITQSGISKMENFDYRYADPTLVKVMLDRYEREL